ncbi:MAG: isopeptide-forming domain-containing fimbrial protein [Lachnospiraceae bacterium]|nr:isopeptide-forming domain-containing fimbrial protein [Lachnospiraceae bacterium]
MKHVKKIMALVLSMVMVLAMGSLTAFAEGTGSITIIPPGDIDSETTNTYQIYKVFDAAGNGTNISYKVMESKNGALPVVPETETNTFFVDDGGNVHYGTFTEAENGTSYVNGQKGTIADADVLSEAAVAAIGVYVTGDTLVATVTSTGTANAVAQNLANGYYYITTTTGTVVTITSTNPNATVDDKNAIPPVPDKTITGVGDGSLDSDGQKALAQVGTTVNFSVNIVKVKGAKNYVFHDTMDEGLSYNSDVAVKVGDAVITKSNTVNTAADNETFITETATGDTLTVTFDNDWLARLEDNTTITITYSATVTSDALSTDPANNTATLEYGNNSKTTGDTVDIYNAKFTVTKTDDKNQPLAGAGFVIAKTVADTSEGAEAGATKTVYYKIANNIVTWVDNIEDATEYKTTTDNNGNTITFTGLADGTYTLIEKTVPEGYNKAADSSFTINANNFTSANLVQSITVINNSGSLLPSTGGMGTTIFYVLGSILVLGAAVLLITRKRMSNRA